MQKAIADVYGVSITVINGRAGPWYYRQPSKEKKLTTELFLAFKDRDEHYEALKYASHLYVRRLWVRLQSVNCSVSMNNV